MCGRSRCTLAPERVVQAAAALAPPTTDANIPWRDQDRFRPSYNLTPGSWTPVIHRPSKTQNAEETPQPREDGICIQSMRWGLVPSFTKPTDKPDPWRMFNARSESVQEKPAFRRLVPTKRCLVLLDGFYEWKAEGKAGKQPYYIYLEGDEPLVCAGLYDTWHGPDGQVMYTYTILTTESSKKLEWLHDRMPVILREKDAQQLWLDTANPASVHKLHSILAPYNGDDLKWHAVTKSMNSPAFQSPQCAEPVTKPSAAAFFQPRKHVPKNEAAAPAVNADEAPPPHALTTPAAERCAEGMEGDAPASPQEEEQLQPAPAVKAGTHESDIGGKKRKEAGLASPGGSASKKKPKLAGQQDITKFFGGGKG